MWNCTNGYDKLTAKICVQGCQIRVEGKFTRCPSVTTITSTNKTMGTNMSNHNEGKRQIKSLSLKLNKSQNASEGAQLVYKQLKQAQLHGVKIITNTSLK